MGGADSVLAQLFARLSDKKGADAKSSYTAQLLAKGNDAICKKLAEEAGETIIAATKQDRGQVVYESADLLYHMMVLWISHGVDLQEIVAELDRRQSQSGIAEKASR